MQGFYRIIQSTDLTTPYPIVELISVSAAAQDYFKFDAKN